MSRDGLKNLIGEMKRENIDYYIIPTADYHNSEYVSPFFKCREYLSGFTGSAGTLVISEKESILWTDGRYFIQAEEQLKGTGILLYKSGEPGVCEIKDYLKNECEKRAAKEPDISSPTPFVTIGFDGRVMDISFVKELEETLTGIAHVNININPLADLVGRIWKDRPELETNKIVLFSEKYAGKSAAEKLNEVRLEMNKSNADCHLLASLDDIAWLLNLRGNDIECSPVFLSYLFISEEDTVLFCDTAKLSDDAREALGDIGVKLMEYDEVYGYLSSFRDGSEKDMGSKKLLICPDTVNYRLYSEALGSFEIILKDNPTLKLKAVKNSTEQENLRRANIADGVAMVKFLKWLDDYKNGLEDDGISELDVSERLLQFRKEGKSFKDISFYTIAAYGAHGAIVHYEPDEKTDIPIQRKGFLLVDSGGQYPEGTTDITRTIALGEVDHRMKKHYTAVLKGNLRLAKAVFPAGVSGANLDILARGPLWDMNEDYNHGTGHGIGSYLNVHEGPQNINWKIGRRKGNSTPLECGMVTSDEPGIYLEGEYGIRLENDLLTVEKAKKGRTSYLGFEILSLAPFDLTPVLWEDMEKSETDALRDYHRMVYEKLSPHLDEETSGWLKLKTVDCIYG